MPLRPCLGCRRLVATTRCAGCQTAWHRARDARRGGTTARGYGSAHQRRRAAELPDAYGRPCARCGRPMREGEKLHLDHTDDRSGYLGFSHDVCDAAAGAAKVNSHGV